MKTPCPVRILAIKLIRPRMNARVETFVGLLIHLENVMKIIYFMLGM